MTTPRDPDGTVPKPDATKNHPMSPSTPNSAVTLLRKVLPCLAPAMTAANMVAIRMMAATPILMSSIGLPSQTLAGRALLLAEQILDWIYGLLLSLFGPHDPFVRPDREEA